MSTRNIVEAVYIDVCDLCGMSSTNRPKPADWTQLTVHPIGRNNAGVHLDACADCWALDKRLEPLRVAAEKIARHNGWLPEKEGAACRFCGALNDVVHATAPHADDPDVWMCRDMLACDRRRRTPKGGA